MEQRSNQAMELTESRRSFNGSVATRLSVVPDNDIRQFDLCAYRLQSRPSSAYE